MTCNRSGAPRPQQADLFGEQEPHFGGETYDPARDRDRLKTSLGRVYSLMRDGRWRSLAEIVNVVGGSEAGISARLRDLRKERFGAYTIDRKNKGGGRWIYRLHQERKAD